MGLRPIRALAALWPTAGELVRNHQTSSRWLSGMRLTGMIAPLLAAAMPATKGST